MRLLLRDLSAALLALHRDAGAGLVVAIGRGAGGEATLLAAQEAAVACHLGADCPHHAASAALGSGRPAFVLGAVPAAEQGWPARAPMLCAALSAAVRADAPPSDQPAMTSERAEMERDCLAALLPPSSPDGAGRSGGGPAAVSVPRRARSVRRALAPDQRSAASSEGNVTLGTARTRIADLPGPPAAAVAGAASPALLEAGMPAAASEEGP